ncbi:hypothetical protein BWQ96_06612 [Gracilariopsis chorda]|uniref:Uncharacterized protein n=1 Tax=Gracilariopsis chorda TaxID=448386 RepID=A0A2V3ING6_9FLOR|nr:hypothetical protein BWQ96_06612 [Gracilariopsis chorda]|eukprot:PXF43603.1 hypothetical protein BWQ96_06612 [Gracilariopsis chorda]
MATILPSTPPPTSPSAMVPNETPSKSCPPSASRPFNTPKAKPYRFSATEDLIIVCEVAAANALITPYGKIVAVFAVASQKANEHEALTVKTSIKSIQDRYKKSQDIFDKQDARERVMSGVCG